MLVFGEVIQLTNILNWTDVIFFLFNDSFQSVSLKSVQCFIIYFANRRRRLTPKVKAEVLSKDNDLLAL